MKLSELYKSIFNKKSPSEKKQYKAYEKQHVLPRKNITAPYEWAPSDTLLPAMTTKKEEAMKNLKFYLKKIEEGPPKGEGGYPINGIYQDWHDKARLYADELIDLGVEVSIEKALQQLLDAHSTQGWENASEDILAST